MTRFRGDTFIPLDDDAFGTGESGGTEVLDTFLSNRIQGNSMFLAQGVECINFSPMTIAGAIESTKMVGDKAFAAVTGWVRVFAADLFIGRDFRGVRVDLVGNVRNEGSDPDGLDVRIKCVIDGVGVFYDEISETDNAGAVLYRQRSYEFLLDRPTTRIRGLRQVAIYTQGRMQTTEYHAQSAGAAGKPMIPDTTTFFDDITGGPDGDTLDVQCLIVADGLSAQNDDMYDMLGNIVRGMLTNPDATYLPDITLERRWISYLTIKGGTLQPLYGLSSIALVPQSSMAPNITLDATPGQLQAQGISQMYKRSMVRHIGPVGVLDSTYEDGGDEPSLGVDVPWFWPFMSGNESEQTLVDFTMWLDTVDPVVTVVMHNMCSQRRADRTTDPGSAKWDYTLLIEQMDAVVAGSADPETDVEELANESESYTHTMQAAIVHSDSPLLKTLFILQSGDASFEEQNYTRTEGLLYEQDRDLLERVVLSAQVSGLSASEGARPVRVRVKAVLDSTEVNYSIGHNYQTSDLRLTNFNHTILEFPQ